MSKEINKIDEKELFLDIMRHWIKNLATPEELKKTTNMTLEQKKEYLEPKLNPQKNPQIAEYLMLKAHKKSLLEYINSILNEFENISLIFEINLETLKDLKQQIIQATNLIEIRKMQSTFINYLNELSNKKSLKPLLTEEDFLSRQPEDFNEELKNAVKFEELKQKLEKIKTFNQEDAKYVQEVIKELAVMSFKDLEEQEKILGNLEGITIAQLKYIIENKAQKINQGLKSKLTIEELVKDQDRFDDYIIGAQVEWEQAKEMGMLDYYQQETKKSKR